MFALRIARAARWMGEMPTRAEVPGAQGIQGKPKYRNYTDMPNPLWVQNKRLAAAE